MARQCNLCGPKFLHVHVRSSCSCSCETRSGRVGACGCVHYACRSLNAWLSLCEFHCIFNRHLVQYTRAMWYTYRPWEINLCDGDCFLWRSVEQCPSRQTVIADNHKPRVGLSDRWFYTVPYRRPEQSPPSGSRSGRVMAIMTSQWTAYSLFWKRCGEVKLIKRVIYPQSIITTNCLIF